MTIQILKMRKPRKFSGRTAAKLFAASLLLSGCSVSDMDSFMGSVGDSLDRTYEPAPASAPSSSSDDTYTGTDGCCAPR